MYVAVKGGEKAIANAHKLLADRRRGDRALPSVTIDQIVAAAACNGVVSGAAVKQVVAAIAV